MLARLLVLLAVGLLAVDAAVLDEETCGAVPELDGVASVFATVGAYASRAVVDCNATHAH